MRYLQHQTRDTENFPTVKPSLIIGWTRDFFRQPRAVRLREVSGETMGSGCFPRVRCENGENCVRENPVGRSLSRSKPIIARSSAFPRRLVVRA